MMNQREFEEGIDDLNRYTYVDADRQEITKQYLRDLVKANADVDALSVKELITFLEDVN
jgi:hypothetical protein